MRPPDLQLASDTDVASGLPTLETRRLRLRWLTAGDVHALFELFRDPEVTRYTSLAPLQDVTAAERMLADVHRGFRERAMYQWGVVRREDDRVIGTATLADVSPAHQRASVGYALAREHWGQGLAGEVLPALVGFAFRVLGLHRVEADVDPRNAASMRALERCGFVREGHLRERYRQAGEWQDAVVYGLLRAEASAGLTR